MMRPIEALVQIVSTRIPRRSFQARRARPGSSPPGTRRCLRCATCSARAPDDLVGSPRAAALQLPAFARAGKNRASDPSCSETARTSPTSGSTTRLTTAKSAASVPRAGANWRGGINIEVWDTGQSSIPRPSCRRSSTKFLSGVEPGAPKTATRPRDGPGDRLVGLNRGPARHRLSVPVTRRWARGGQRGSNLIKGFESSRRSAIHESAPRPCPRASDDTPPRSCFLDPTRNRSARRVPLGSSCATGATRLARGATVARIRAAPVPHHDSVGIEHQSSATCGCAARRDGIHAIAARSASLRPTRWPAVSSVTGDTPRPAQCSAIPMESGLSCFFQPVPPKSCSNVLKA